MELKLLGPVEMSGPSGSLVLRGNKERVLLALLAVNANRIVSMADLIAGLWGEDPPLTAAKTAHGHVARLRRALDAAGLTEVLRTREPGYVLQISPQDIDVVRFEQRLRDARIALGANDPRTAQQELEAALALWRGEALVDCRERSEMLRGEAVRLDELKLTTIEELVHVRLALGRHADLVGELESLLVRYPLREHLWSALILSLYRSQRQGDALRAYQRARDTLIDTLGVEPGLELRRLEAAVLERDPSLELAENRLATGNRLRDAPSRLTTWARSGPTFVGRDAERQLLEDAFEAAMAGLAQVVFISGDPGIGKTRLAAEVAVSVRPRGAVTLYGRCDEGLAVPFQPFVEALRSYVENSTDSELDVHLGRYLGDLARLVPVLAQRIPALGPPLQSDPATEQYRLFDAVVAWLQASAHAAPILLVLDDLHWAARPTVLLLRHLIRSEPLGRVLILATYRRSELDARHPLAEVIADLPMSTAVMPFHRLDLVGLDGAEIAGFVQAATGISLEQESSSVVALRAHTDGNPFFLDEIVRNNREQLAQAKADTSRDDSPDLQVPAGARGVVTRRVARLSREAQRVLAIASVMGFEFDVAVLHALVRGEIDALFDSLEEAVVARLIDEVGDDRYSFAHAIIRRAVYDTINPSRRAHMHGAVGNAIEDLHGDDLQRYLPELVAHFVTADIRKAIRYSIDAANVALDSLAFEDSARMCGYGLDAIERARTGGMNVDRTQHCELMFTLGRAELRSGNPQGRRSLLRAYDLAKTIGDPPRQAAAVLAVNRGFFARVGRVDHELVATLEDAIAAQPPQDTGQLAELVATLASELVWADDGDRRFALSDTALEMARRASNPRALARVLLLRSMTVLAPDNLDERRDLSNELLQVAQSLGDPALLFDAAFSHSGTAWEAGDVEQANRMEELATSLAHELRQPRLIWQASFMRTSRLIAEGALTDAEEAAVATLEQGRRAHQDAEAFIFFTEQMLEIRRWQSRLVEMLDMFRDVAGNPRVDFGYSLTRYLYDADERDLARATYEQLKGTVALPPRRDMLALASLYSLAYLAVRFGDRDYARDLYGCLGPYGTCFAHTTVAKPIGAHYLGMLAATIGKPDLAERHFTIALAAHAAANSPLFVAETQLEAALAYGGQSSEFYQGLLEHVRATGIAHGANFLIRRSEEVPHPEG